MWWKTSPCLLPGLPVFTICVDASCVLYVPFSAVLTQRIHRKFLHYSGFIWFYQRLTGYATKMYDFFFSPNLHKLKLSISDVSQGVNVPFQIILDFLVARTGQLIESILMPSTPLADKNRCQN